MQKGRELTLRPFFIVWINRRGETQPWRAL